MKLLIRQIVCLILLVGLFIPEIYHIGFGIILLLNSFVFQLFRFTSEVTPYDEKGITILVVYDIYKTLVLVILCWLVVKGIRTAFVALRNMSASQTRSEEDAASKEYIAGITKSLYVGGISGLLIIGIIASLLFVWRPIMVPSYWFFRNTSCKNECANNLRLIDAAKEQLAMGKGLAPNDSVDVESVNRYLSKTPICPEGGVYVYGPIGIKPTCSYSWGKTKHTRMSMWVIKAPLGPGDHSKIY